MELSYIISSSIFLGVGLAMDAFSVSMANGLHEPDMSRRKLLGIASAFGFFQFIMPIAGWFCVHNIANHFKAVQPFIPWVSLVLLLYISIGLFLEGFRQSDDGAEKRQPLGIQALMLQGIATSIDALSLGFTIARYNSLEAFLSASIIAVVTFFICCSGVGIGKRFGMLLSQQASIMGGVILVLIGLRIFLHG